MKIFTLNTHKQTHAFKYSFILSQHINKDELNVFDATETNCLHCLSDFLKASKRHKRFTNKRHYFMCR